MLTQMESGADYVDALAEAQQKGYAEADPSGDVEGHDAAGKVVILANLLMGLPLTMKDVSCEGITRLTPDDISAAVSESGASLGSDDFGSSLGDAMGDDSPLADAFSDVTIDADTLAPPSVDVAVSLMPTVSEYPPPRISLCTYRTVRGTPYWATMYGILRIKLTRFWS